MRQRLAFVGGMALCAAAAGAVLWPGLQSWFVADDYIHLFYMQGIPHPFHLLIYPNLSAKFFHPLSQMLMYGLGRTLGLTPGRLHAADLMLHALNAMLVFVLADALISRARPPEQAPHSRAGLLAPPLAAGLIYAVHPVAALTANWFACFPDLIATCWSLLTLILIARAPRPGNLALIVSGLTALAALLSKETHLPLFLMAFWLGLITSEGRPAARLKSAAIKALPAFNATLIYLGWRMAVLGHFGGYEPLAPGFSGLMAQLSDQLPRVLHAGGRDLLFHHLTRADPIFLPLAISGAALAAAGGLAALFRQGRVLLVGLGIIAAGMAPFWNLAQMMELREERLLYLPLVGLALFVAALVAGPRRWWLTGGAMAAVLFAGAGYALISYEAIGDWRVGAEHGRKAVAAVAKFITASGPNGPIHRVYVLGLPPDSYVFNTMVKMELGPEYQDREALPAEHDSLVWDYAARREQDPTIHLPKTALPSRLPYPTDPDLVFENVSPPNLIDAASADRAARVLEWSGARVTDLTPRCRQLAAQRRYFRDAIRKNPSFLPSFPFTASPLHFDWTASPGLTKSLPPEPGQPYLFRAANDDPYLVSPRLDIPPLWAAALELAMRVPARAYTPPGQDRACLQWETANRPGFPPENTSCIKIIADGDLHTYRFPLDPVFAWDRSPGIARIRLDPISFPGSFEISYLEFEAK